MGIHLRKNNNRRDHFSLIVPMLLVCTCILGVMLLQILGLDLTPNKYLNCLIGTTKKLVVFVNLSLCLVSWILLFVKGITCCIFFPISFNKEFMIQKSRELTTPSLAWLHRAYRLFANNNTLLSFIFRTSVITLHLFTFL